MGQSAGLAQFSDLRVPPRPILQEPQGEILSANAAGIEVGLLRTVNLDLINR
jgi:hypothetical protein